MEHRIYNRSPLGNLHRVWKQNNFILSTFGAHSDSMRDSLENCKEAGFNMVEMGWASHAQAEEALRLCEELQLDFVFQDFSRFGGMQEKFLEHRLTDGELRAITDHIRPYRHCVGYYVWDEPYQPEQLAEARRQADMFQAADPGRLPFTVAIPSYNREYRWENGLFEQCLRDYVTVIDPPVLSLDYYPYWLPPYYSDETQTDNSLMWLDLGLMRKLGREYRLPLWFYYQGINLHHGPHFEFSMVRMSMYAAALYGCKGLQQYTAVGAVTDRSGRKGIFFEDQKAVHAEFARLGNTLMALENRYVFHSPDLLPGDPYIRELSDRTEDSEFFTGELEPRVSAGELCDAYGNTYALILNRDWTVSKNVTLRFRKPLRIYTVSRETGRQSVLCENVTSLTLPLAPGDGTLIRLQDADAEPFTAEYRLEK